MVRAFALNYTPYSLGDSRADSRRDVVLLELLLSKIYDEAYVFDGHARLQNLRCQYQLYGVAVYLLENFFFFPKLGCSVGLEDHVLQGGPLLC